MLIEQGYQNPGIGTLNVVGDAAGDDLLINEIEFGEFVDLSGMVHGPLTPACVVLIMANACCEAHVLYMIELVTAREAEDV